MKRTGLTTRLAQREKSQRSLVRPSRLNVEGLEPRLLLFATSGGAWPHPELVTVSFMPDGTDVGGLPSSLVGTMNGLFPTATWQKEMLRSLQSFAANANLNFSVASDDGSAFGSAGSNPADHNVQGDNDFGDIRLGAALIGTPLGIAMFPPNNNVDTAAGDFLLNSATTWNIGSTYDLYTVSAHESGHSLGLCHSDLSTAVLYSTYNGVKSNLTADDISGIQSIYGARPQDSFDAASSNNVKGDATVITSYIDANKQVTINDRDITTNSDVDWYKISTPSGNSGTMVVQVQSTGLSLFAPKVTVYKGSNLKGTASGDYNSTVSISNAIGNGQNWFVKVEGAEAGVFGTGKYSLQINMGSTSLPGVPIPNTDTPVGGEPVFTGCDNSEHDLDHGAGQNADVTVITTDEVEAAASTAQPTSMSDLSLGTNFDLDHSPFANIIRTSGAVSTNAGHERARHDASAVDFVLDGGLDDLFANSLSARR